MKFLHFWKINILIVLVVLVACSSGQPDKQDEEGTIVISGTVGYPQQGIVLLEKYQGNQPIAIDTIEVNEDYKFDKRVKIEKAGYYRLNFYNKQFVALILDRDDIEVVVDGNARNGFASVSGSRDHDFINTAQQLNQTLQQSPEVAEINTAFAQASQTQNEKAIDSLRNAYMKLDDTYKQKLIDQIDTIGASLGVVEILRNGRILDRDKYYDVYKNYATILKEEMSDVEVAEEFVKEVEQMAKLAIGQVAPEIELPNPDGELVKLSSLRGNYVLVDFWAKWCRPCRMENPNVVRMYNKYNDQGFEVFGVSLDRKKEDWLLAIEQDGLTWTHVSDLKYFNSEAAKIYNVNAIPFAVLIDPEGVIIAKNLRGAQLEAKLEELFSEKG